MGSKYSKAINPINDASNSSFQVPFVALQEATNNFDESLVIGLGGFGNIYRGVLSDGTKVALKRCRPESSQGTEEFQTEIEMLSQLCYPYLTRTELDQTHVSTIVKGTLGYLDPEYLIRGKLTEKFDVYSFGVVLFEVLCARLVIGHYISKEMVSLAPWAMNSQEKGQLELGVAIWVFVHIYPF
ncbi:hypothetical protein KY284_023322 [Solanum tuberosum]|nr:hypothetical protein KY284_023322 [Solanum tuberosum]